MLTEIETSSDDIVSTDDLKRYHDEALAWVNEQRVKYGREPIDSLPKGEPSEMAGCVLFRALADVFVPDAPSQCVGRRAQLEVHEVKDATFTWGGVVPVPANVGKFAAAFDRGMLPEFEDR